MYLLRPLYLELLPLPSSLLLADDFVAVFHEAVIGNSHKQLTTITHHFYLLPS